MSKSQLISTSLVAAAPGGFLLYFMLMAVLNELGKMPTMLQAVSITLVVMSMVLVVFPLYLLVFYGRAAAVAGAKVPNAAPAAKKGKEVAEKKAPAAKANAAAPFEEVEELDELESVEEEDEMFDLDGEDDVEPVAAGTEVFALDDDSSGDAEMFESDEEFEFEEFEFDDDFDDDPKKK